MSNAKKDREHSLVLAIDPAPRGFGYALFESPNEPLDWGVKDVRIFKNKQCLKKIKKLIEYYNPEVLVLEDCYGKGARRCPRIKALIDKVECFARSKKITVIKYPRGKIRETFAIFGARNKFQIAKVICDRLPVFSSRQPPEREIWMSEDSRMNIFDAISMVIIYYYHEE